MTAPLTPEERAVVAGYLRARADDLGLRDYDFEFAHEPTPEGLSGRISGTIGQRCARLELAHGFRGLDPEEQRDTLIHEVLHVHREALRLYIEETLPDLLGKPAYHAFIQAYRSFDETAVDTVSVAIAPFFPLIEWPSPASAEETIDSTGGS